MVETISDAIRTAVAEALEQTPPLSQETKDQIAQTLSSPHVKERSGTARQDSNQTVQHTDLKRGTAYGSF